MDSPYQCPKSDIHCKIKATLLIKDLKPTLIKDVRAQNVPTYRFLLHLPRRKVMIYFCQKGRKMRGHRVRFRDHEVHFEKLALF